MNPRMFCDTCQREFKSEMGLKIHTGRVHGPGSMPKNDDEALVKLARIRGFSKWARDQPPDSTGGALHRTVGRMLTPVDKGGPGLKPRTSSGVERWPPLVREYKKLLDQQETVDPIILADVETVLSGWSQMIVDWKAEVAGAEVILGQADYSRIGDAIAPTAEAPVPVVRCLIPHCSGWAVLGGNRCERHGGQWLPVEVRQAMLMTSYEGLVEASKIAVETLVDVMQNSRRDDARVAASREVLDRVGITGGADIHLHLHGAEDDGDSTVAKIRNRLTEMNEAMEEAAKLRISLGIDNEIIDAEVVEDIEVPG